MKTFPKLFLPAWLIFFLLPVQARADRVEDLKAEISATLPLGSHEDRVRQFLKVRKIKITDSPKQKIISGRLVTERTGLTIVFQFDDERRLTGVTYLVTSTGS